MKCVVCKHGQTSEGETTVTLTRGNTTVVFRKVHADVCDNCGEAYVDEEVTGKPLEEAKQITAAGSQIDVRIYKAA
jgi:YgiT-type zinc finger domain-containing protein